MSEWTRRALEAWAHAEETFALEGCRTGMSDDLLGAFGCQAMSALLHLGVLGALALFVPHPELVEGETTSAEDVALITRMLAVGSVDSLGLDEESETGEADDDASRAEAICNHDPRPLGAPHSDATPRRLGIPGPSDNPDPHLAREAALEEASHMGLIGFLREGAVGFANAPTAPWGRDDVLGTDSAGGRGSMWGDSIGDVGGAGGLGLSGVGQGNGGAGRGIALAAIESLGHGEAGDAGYGCSGACGCGGQGRGRGRLGAAHVVRSPHLRCGGTSVTGRLPPEVIQRIVRQNFGRFRFCYEQGLQRQPDLLGRVTIKFVIARDGSVAEVADAGSDLPDGSVASCVLRAFTDLSFPEPEGGIVNVVYPIVFSSSDG